MKKIVAAALSLMLSCSVVFAAESNEKEEAKETSSSSASSGFAENKITGEVYLAALGMSFNQAVTYDRMFSEKMGAGLGILVSESSWTDFGLFGDFKLEKWNFGLGFTLNTNSDADRVGYLMRAIYHGNSWQWGPGKAGMTLGFDWHCFGFETDGNDMTGLLYFLPRFVCGVNWQLDF